MKMRNSERFMYGKTVALSLALSAFLFNACDKGIDADETFVSEVTNSTLQSPKAEDVSLALTPDGGTLIVNWAVVRGAGGYEFTLYNVDDPANPKVVGDANEVVDGCRITRSVESDTKYQVSIRTLGNEKYNNKDAAEPLKVAYSTLAPTDATIETGCDINAWLVANPIPSEKLGQEYTIDLVAGQEYTVSDIIDFANQQVTIRGNKVGHARIKMLGEASFLTNNGFKLKFVDVDCAGFEGETFFGTSKTAEPASQLSTGEFLVANPIMLQGCNITGMKNYLFYDKNSVNYCIDYLGFMDCNIQIAQNSEIIRAAKSAIIRMDVVNSTIWSTVQADKYFMQISGQRPNKIAAHTGAEFNFKNTTFYNLAYNKDFVNWNNYRGQPCVQLNFYNTIFADCGRGDITNKMQGNANMKHDYQNNAYWYNGAGNDKYDTGALFEDPLFVNPAGGNFTSGNPNYVAKSLGDSRWLSVK